MNNENENLSFLEPKEANRASLLIAKLQLNKEGALSQLDALLELQRILWSQVPKSDGYYQGVLAHRITASLGLIEETMEYLSSIGYKPWRPTPLPKEKQLEELVDQLFFYLELIMFSGFTIEQVVEGYTTKWYENMDRYRKAKQNDYSWDKRLEKEGL